MSRLSSSLRDVGFLKLLRRSSEGDRDLFLDLLLLRLDSDEPPSLLLLESRPLIVRTEFEETLSSSSSTWWSIRVSAPQLSIKLLETVNARGPSFDEFPSVVDRGGIPVATVGRLTSEIVVATVGRLTTGRRDATVGRLISATSLAATVGRLTTKFPREDDAPPVPSAA